VDEKDARDTLNGQQITVPGDQNQTGMPFVLKVGGQTIFQGSAEAVNAQNATKS
jgi:hypothetical protein